MKWRAIFLCSMILLCIALPKEASSLPAFFLSDFIYQNKSTICPELTGRVVFPSQPEYNNARLVSNYYTSKDRYPDVVVYCQNTKDVQNAVLWARCNKKPIRIRSGGHNHEAFSTGSGAIVIDVSEMKQLEVNNVNRTAKIQPGLNNLELYTKLYKEGFTHVGGTCSEVGLSGLVLTGGMGPLLRRVGLTCDSLISLEMVDANGRLINVTKDNEYKDLFWASCGGGGGNFGVVTSMVINLYPADDVTWFNIGWDWNHPIDKIVTAWLDFFGKDDRQWFSHLDIWSKTFPRDDLKKEPLKVLGVFWGSPEEARRQLATLLNISKPNEVVIEKVTWDQAIKNIEDSTAVFLTAKPEYKSTGAYVKDTLPSEVVKIITETLENSSSPLFNVLLFSMGGATAEIAPQATAYYYRDDKFFINYSLQWLQRENDKKSIEEIDTLRKRLLPYTEGDYVGNPDMHLADYLVSYYGKNVDRLRCVKRKYDPLYIFNFEQSIPPAPAMWKCQ